MNICTVLLQNSYNKSQAMKRTVRFYLREDAPKALGVSITGISTTGGFCIIHGPLRF